MSDSRQTLAAADDTNMAPADENSELPRSSSAIQKRTEQLKRWAQSETNKELLDSKEKRRKVAFQDDCVFLAACAAGEQEEVLRMLSRGSDINTANVDGLTALHQACIDDRIDMVKFLVERGADINRGDNEGWTPLHATASCGYLSIAKFLIERGARVDIVNNDGELPIDIADTDEMESLLQSEIFKQGVDIDLARSEEEQIMLRDVREWYNGNSVKENVHPKTGATPLHVAAAKGYVEVMRMLLDLGDEINTRDVDGWTPLHAAAHWGHRDCCRMLAEYGCDMDVKTNMGQLAADVCEADMISFVEDLQKKQPMLMKEKLNQLDQSNQRVTSSILRKRISGADKLIAQTKDVFSPQQRPAPRDALSLANSPFPHQSNQKNPQEQIGVTPKEVKPYEHSKPMNFLQTSPEKAPDNRNTAVNPSVLSSSSIKPISFLPPADAKPMSFAPSRESQFPLTSKLSPTDRAEGRSAQNSMDQTTPTNLFRPEESRSTGPYGQKSPNQPNQPATPVAVHKTMSSPVTAQTTTKPPLPHMSSLEFIDDGSGPESPAATKERLLRRATDWPRGWPGSLEFPNTKPPLTHTQPVPVKKVSPSERPSANLPVTMSDSKTGGNLPPSTFFGSPNPAAAEASSTATVRRSFQPPARDEESEAQRKAHAKRVRETRRSTQGVSADDLKAADAQAKAQNQAVVPPPPSKTENLLKEEEKENERRRSSILSLLTIPGVTGNAPDPSRSHPLTVPPSPEPIVTLPLRKTKQDEETDDQKNSRRRRPKRRSTGVVHIDMEDEEGSASGTDLLEMASKTENNIPNGQVQGHGTNGTVGTPTSSDRSYTRTKYESPITEKSPTPSSYRAGRAGSTSSISSTISSDKEPAEQDWKKLYEQEKAENEKLKKKLNYTEKELSDLKTESQKPTERRALERKIAEMEEELKELESLRADNQRLKEENGALIRVISKLSK